MIKKHAGEIRVAYSSCRHIPYQLQTRMAQSPSALGIECFVRISFVDGSSGKP